VTTNGRFALRNASAIGSELSPPKIEVQHGRVRLVRFEKFERLGHRTRGSKHGAAPAFEQVLIVESDQAFVIDDKNALSMERMRIENHRCSPQSTGNDSL
jgi:hypothetical protein